MAKVKISPTALGIIGSVSGPVFARRGPTTLARTPYRPSTPSAAQIKVRAAFSFVDSSWAYLSTEDKASWYTWGKWRRNSAYNRYMSINIPQQLADLPLISNAGDIP